MGTEGLGSEMKEGWALLFKFFVLDTVDSRYLDFGYLEQPLISKKKSSPCLNIEI